MSIWSQTRRQNLLPIPQHDQNLLPVPRSNRGERLIGSGHTRRKIQTFIQKSKDIQVVNEFRNKLRLAEDLISKLAFSLREIQGMGKKPKEKKAKNKASRLAQVLPVQRSADKA